MLHRQDGSDEEGFVAQLRHHDHGNRVQEGAPEHVHRRLNTSKLLVDIGVTRLLLLMPQPDCENPGTWEARPTPGHTPACCLHDSTVRTLLLEPDGLDRTASMGYVGAPGSWPVAYELYSAWSITSS